MVGLCYRWALSLCNEKNCNGAGWKSKIGKKKEKKNIRERKINRKRAFKYDIRYVRDTTMWVIKKECVLPDQA